MTPSEKINPQLALDEKNADVQREIIRKIGAERLLKATNAETIDNGSDPKTGLVYSLKKMTIGNNINRQYLWFEHASIPGVFYAKAVPPEAKKALHARAWIVGIIERDALADISAKQELEILSQLPEWTS
jgi:hypothetical protein